MRKLLISLFSIIIMISMITSVEAATTGQITLTPSEKIIKAGNEFSITIKAADSNNLNSVEYSGITITDASGKTINSIKGKSVDTDWFKTEAEGKTVFVYGGSAVKEQDVCKITFTTNSDISAGTYNININGLVVYSTNLDDIKTEIGPKKVSINIEENKPEGGNTTGGNTTGGNTTGGNTTGGNTTGGNTTGGNTTGGNTTGGNTTGGNTTGGNTTGGNTTGENKPTANNSTNNQATKLPQTGLTNITVIGLAVLIIMIIMSYVSYIRIKDI